MKIIQVELYNPEINSALTTWVDSRPDLKKGSIISLKDFKPEIKWIVRQVHQKEHETHDFDFHRKWDNNNYDKHKGLKING